MTTTVRPIDITACQYYRGADPGDPRWPQLSLSIIPAVAITSVQDVGESGLRPGSQGTQATETPGALNPKGAYGISSWNGQRQVRLANFATAHNVPVDDVRTQQWFTLNEIWNFYPKTKEAVTDTTLSLKEVITVFVEDYEDPADPAAEITRSLVLANALMAVVSTMPIVAPVKPAPVAPVVATKPVLVAPTVVQPAPAPVVTTPYSPPPMADNSISVQLLRYLDLNAMDADTVNATIALLKHFRGLGL